MTITEPFGHRLVAAIESRGPLCVGIDPHPGLLKAWDLPDDAGGLERFAMTVVEALGPTVAVLKPQSAFFEAHGAAGIAVLEEVLTATREAGALSILDGKRGDIGSTMAAYAAAYLTHEAPLAADALTVSPYLGFGSLLPTVDVALAEGRGLFVLALTSNPEGPEVQGALATSPGGEADDAAPKTVAGTVLGHLRSANADAAPLGSFGAVVGATLGATGEDLAINGPLLAPGYGAQGGTLADLERIFGGLWGVPGQVLPSTSRGLLRAGPELAALRAAAERDNDRLRALLSGTPR